MTEARRWIGFKCHRINLTFFIQQERPPNPVYHKIFNRTVPCGFVYVGLAGSLTTGSILSGSLYMMLFGLGTLPAMLAMSLAPGFISLNTRRRINLFIPAAAVLFGVFLIFRGLMMVSGH